MTTFDMTLTQKLADDYVKADRIKKGRILLDYCKLTGIKKNTAVKRLIRKHARIKPQALKVVPGRKRGPKTLYDQKHKLLIERCWELAGEICAERLYPMLAEYITALDTAGELTNFDAKTVSQTKAVSLGTLKTILAGFLKSNYAKKHKGNPELYKYIPVKANFGQYAETLGNIEVDFVEHSGGLGNGTFAITACYVDICSGWLARSACLGKNLEGVSATHKLNLGKIYHNIKEFHPDNAKTILNVLFLQAKNNPDINIKGAYQLSRSRPYKKNDNAHVEQKNGDKVRRLVGYHRYDTKEQVQLLNKLYTLADLYDNFFIPSAKLKEKVKDAKNRVIRKVYDKPQTPYMRILKSRQASKAVKQKLSNIYSSLDMVKLKTEMDKLVKELINFSVS